MDFDNDTTHCPYCHKSVDPDTHDFDYCADPLGGDGEDD